MKYHSSLALLITLALFAVSCGSDADSAETVEAPVAAEKGPTAVAAPTVPQAAAPAEAEPEPAVEGDADIQLAAFPLLYQDFITENGGSKWVEVLGSQMHYIEAGDPDGEAILLGHGAPTNSFLWRDVIDQIATPGRRVIAFDLIGFGRSDHPDLDYSFATHADYVEGFVDALGLTDVHLVLHDVSGQAGFGYAAANPDNVSSIISSEVLYRSFESLDEMGPFAGAFFEQIQTPGVGEAMMIEQNLAVTALLDSGTATDLPTEVRDVYGWFFTDPTSRDVNLEFARSTPIAGQPEAGAAFVDGYAAWLIETDIPKLVLRPDAGVVPSAQYDTAAALPNVTVVDLVGSGHFVQEDNPVDVASAINDFYTALGI